MAFFSSAFLAVCLSKVLPPAHHHSPAFSVGRHSIMHACTKPLICHLPLPSTSIPSLVSTKKDEKEIWRKKGNGEQQ
ncbi:hypothetical protein BC567DRAFT_86860 [Phyllosticta citribraziliensis]